ncbi:MAG: hypothetical protein WB041_25020, partial [Pseudolabrys sp.]
MTATGQRKPFRGPGHKSVADPASRTARRMCGAFPPLPRAAVAAALGLLPELPLIAGGKSFGGRMTSQ